MQFSQKVVAVIVGLIVFFFGYLVFLILCNFILNTAK